jgi:hypothetical protein
MILNDEYFFECLLILGSKQFLCAISAVAEQLLSRNGAVLPYILFVVP